LEGSTNAAAEQQQAKSDSVGLDISNHALTRLPAPLIDRLPLLSSLDLSSNFISSVAAHLPHFSGLVSLDLSHNFITSFSPRPQDHNATAPAAMDDNGQLRSPDASASGSFERLDRLHLADNRLWVVDQLPASLTELNVAHNAIEHLPRHLATLTQLRVLNVAYNKLLTDQGNVALYACRACVVCVVRVRVRVRVVLC
jgi:Leucine-rich repeat (LRR) protein